MTDIDLEKMEKIIALMIDNDLSELQYSNGELKIELKRGCSAPPHTFTATPMVTPPPISAVPVTPPEPPPDEFDGLVAISSPMVGTFYASPEPGAPPFISLGSTINKDSTVCQIEAMKVFNEIKAEVSGVVERIMVNNAEAVEFGQVLFYVRPN